MAGALVELAGHSMPREFRRIDPCGAKVVLVEAGPRFLSGFPQDLADEARRTLEDRRLRIMTGQAVTQVTAEGVECGETRIPASALVWAAGVMATPAGTWLGAETDMAGRIAVEPDLSAPDHPAIFVVGDLAAAKDARGRRVPGIAPAAKQMGRHVGRILAERAHGRNAAAPFRCRHHGNLATIGRRSAVVDLDGSKLRGLVGWWFWGIAHVWFLIGFRSHVVVSFEGPWNYRTFQRGARLITGRQRDE